MSVAITIRHVPDQVRDELAARAASSGRSLQEFLLGQLIAMSEQTTLEEVTARARRRARMSDYRIDVVHVLEDRDEDHR